MWRDYEKDVFCPAGLGDGVLPDRLQCGGVKQTAEETEETTEELFEADSEYISEEDLLPFIALYDLYVVQRSETSADTAEAEAEDEQYDPLYCLSTLDIYNEDVVLSVAFDSAAVDVTVPGDYELTFIVTIDRNAYNAAVSGTASTEPVTEEVIIVKTVHIVTTEDYATALADGTISEVVEGTAIVVVEDEVDEEVLEEDSDEEDGENTDDADNNDTSDDDSQDNDNTNSSTDKSDFDNTSTNNDSDTSNVTSPTTTSAPATSTGSGSSTSGSSTSSGSTSSGSSSGTTNTGSTSSGSTSSGSTSSGSTSSGSTSSGSTSSGSTSSGSTSSGSSSGSTSSSTSSPTATPAPTAHVHTWVTETVEDGYYESRVTGYEYDYDNATYVEGYYQCNGCSTTASTADEIGNHLLDVHDGGTYHYVSSHWEGLVEVPVYEEVWVDTSYTITYCSECGATQ